MKIVDLKVHAIKPFGSVRNNSRWKKKKNVFSFVKITTDEGVEGCAVSSLPGGNPMALESVIEFIKPEIIGKDPLDRELIYYILNFTGPFFRINRFFNSAIDCALWDIAGKAAGMPIYKMLGAYRDKIPAYASTLSYDTIEEYIALAHECADAGFVAYKIHGFNEPDKDIELCEAVRAEFPKMELMLDSMGCFERDGALKVGRALERLNFRYFESPIREEDIEGHCMLRRKLDIPISGTELNLYGFLGYPDNITRGAVDIVRTFGDYIGGITPMVKTAHLCEAHHLKNEPHSFGPTLVQAAHLHVMLAMRNCDFFEVSVPQGVFDAGMKDVIRVEKDGMIYAPTKPGLGYDIDWDYINENIDRVF